MHLPAISPNILIILAIAGGMVYGAAGGKHRLRMFILSIYVGIVIATQFAAIVVAATHQPTDLVTLGLFFLPILLFGFSGKSGGKHDHQGELLANLVVGLAAGALLAASALKLLPPSEANSLTDGALVASLLLQYQLWLVALLPIVAFVLGLMKSKDKHH
ncbi:hypothetical protein HJC99_00075 [Candidatus Saccharibacteria bacterium]|nr:hypothetical protein [Candidatus Saccharibacteria bacterium]